MKKLTCSLIIFIIFIQLSHGQESGNKVISTNLVGLSFFLLSRPVYNPDLSFEYLFHESLSGVLTVETGNFAEFTSGSLAAYSTSVDEHMTFKGWGITPEIRYYPQQGTREAPQGFSFGLYYKYLQLTQDYSGQSIYYFYINSGATAFKQKGTVSGPGIDMAYKAGLAKVHTEFLFGFTFAHASGFIFDDRAGAFKNDRLNTGVMTLRLEVRLGYQF